jgi:phosphatidylserine/phosphatidylglycerophosphate/cardiolipin synthase-like enzyme
LQRSCLAHEFAQELADAMVLDAAGRLLKEPLEPKPIGLSRRAFGRMTTSSTWNLIWDAGPYYEKVALALEEARSFVVFVGWQIDSRLELSVSRRETFKQTILRLCRQKPDLHFYFLMWDYSWLYALERERFQSLVWANIHERVHFIFDRHHPRGASHHEKLVLLDGERAFVGGVDICDDRWDSSQHLYFDRRRSRAHDRESHRPYHDLSVEIRGPAARDLVRCVGERWSDLSSIPFPHLVEKSEQQGDSDEAYQVLISRTRASVNTKRPRLLRETEFLFRDLIRSAQSQLIIENQYYWSEAINEELMALMQARRGTEFKIFMVLPSGYGGSWAFKMMGVTQARLLKKLHDQARATSTQLFVGCPFVRSPDGRFERPMYVHSKVIIVDDRYMAIGSSNFNNRGLRLDTELTLTLVANEERSRRLIVKLAESIKEHWRSETVYLKPFFESWRRYFNTFPARMARHVGWEKVLDPICPVSYSWNSRYVFRSFARLSKSVPVILLVTVGLAISVLAFVSHLER